MSLRLFVLFIKNFFASLILALLYSGCICLEKKMIIPGINFSEAIRYNSSMYFLCSYSIITPGRTIFPMYFYIEGDVLFHELCLYEYNFADESLTKIACVDFPEKGDYRPDISNVRLMLDNNFLYIKIPSRLKSQPEFVNIDLQNRSLVALSEVEKEKIDKEIEKLPLKRKEIISASEVYSIVDFIKFDEWRLKSPFEIYSMSLSQCKDALIERKGNDLLNEIIFQRIKKECSRDELIQLALKIKKRHLKLESYERMIYAPYMERWYGRLMMEARYGSKNSGDSFELGRAIYSKDNVAARALLLDADDYELRDPDGMTLLMIAACADNYEIAKLLLQKAAINGRDNMGCTPLMYAVFGNSLKTMKLLLENKADTSLSSSSNYTAWMHISNYSLRKAYMEVSQEKK